MSRYTSDLSLAEGLRDGRADAYERLYAEQHAAVYNLCARILSDREEAADVTHDTFVTAFSNPPAATAGVKLRPWLFRVATNACFNRLRARRHTRGDGEAIAAVPDRVDEYRRAETVALVEASLAAMSERYRAALVLKDLHGLPTTEIAGVLDVSRPAADVLVHRARGAFRAAFEQLGGSATAPANLSHALTPLSVPAALQAMPPLPHPAVPAHPVPAAPHGPAGGLLAKLAAASGTKLAIGAAAALLVAGGAVEVVRHEQHHGAAQAAARPAAAPPAPAGRIVLTSQPARVVHTRYGCLEWRTPHDLSEIHHWCDAREAAQGGTCSDTTPASHDGEHATTAATSGSHENDHTSSTTQTGHDGSSTNGSSADGTTTHDSGGTHDACSDGGSCE